MQVVAGILRRGDGAVLIADRLRNASMQDRWEFPGGKVSEGESADAALRRELAEELGIEVLVASHFRRLQHDYPALSVAIDFFLVAKWLGKPRGVEGQRLKWVDVAILHEQKLLDADAPVIGALQAT